MDRARVIENLLLRAGVPLEAQARSNTRVPQRIILKSPHWITRLQAATVLEPSQATLLATFASRREYAPGCALTCGCGQPLTRWRLLPATFFTLARGVLQGSVVALHCARCKAVYAGCWRWSAVTADAACPGGFHRPCCSCMGLGTFQSIPMPEKDTAARLRDDPAAFSFGFGDTISAFHVIYLTTTCTQ